MPKPIKYLILKFLVVAVFVSVLVVFGLTYDTPEQGEAASTQAYSGLTCDEFIPIGTALDEVIDILDEAFKEYQGENMAQVMGNITSVMATLTEHPNVCDFKKCMALVDDQGPEAIGIEFNAFFWKGELTFKIPPWCVPQEGISEPCPDVSQYLEESDANIMGLTTLRNSFMSSAQRLHDIFETATVPLSADFIRYLQDEYGDFVDADGNLLADGEEPVPDKALGEKVTRADLVLRMTEKVELQLTPGTYKSCALSTLERKLVADGRIGDIFPMQCKQAREAGLYWPNQWSLECAKKCSSGSEKDCIKCLKKPPKNSASQLAKINYKIYGECEKECSEEYPPNSGERRWAMTEKCQECLCTKTEITVVGMGMDETVSVNKTPLSETECLAWLCGGSTSNWVCCHQTPLEGVPERPEEEPFTN